MSMTNPFIGYMAWIIPIFIWIYISYNTSSFYNYFILLLGILIVSINRGSTEIMNMKNKKYYSSINYIQSVPLAKWPFEMSIFFYSVLSIISVSSYLSDFVAFTLFWLAISGLVYMLITTILFFYQYRELIVYFRSIGAMLRIIWDAKRIMRKIEKG